MQHNNPRLAFVTYSGIPDLSPDDTILAKYLTGKNMEISIVNWDDPKISWTTYDAVIIRSPWDYFTRITEFNAWLKMLAASGARVMNPISVIEWNKDKNYFDDLQTRGFAFPPYKAIKQGSSLDLRHLLADEEWEKAVVKPAVSGGAHNTWITTQAAAASDNPRAEAMLAEGDIIVQKFMKEVVQDGEISLLFFNKEFSHAVRKNAVSGDFRVQSQFGGTVTAFIPSQTLIRQAQALLDSIPEPLLYARVDGIELPETGLCLMELELIEPALFVGANAKACERFYDALMELL